MEAIPMCQLLAFKTKFQLNTPVLFIIKWRHVSTLQGHHQAFIMNQLVKKLHTLFGIPRMYAAI